MREGSKILSLRKILLFILFCLNIDTALGVPQKAPTLASLRENILGKEKEVKQQVEQQKNVISQLKKQEKDLLIANQNLLETQQFINQLDQEIKTLISTIDELNNNKQKQEVNLMQQLDAAFRQGKHKEWRWLLNNQAALRRSRMLMYFNYLNQARENNMRELEKTSQALTLKQSALKDKQLQQKKLLENQKIQQKALQKLNSERRQSLILLERELKKNKADLAQMRENERRLQQEILRAENEAKARAALEDKQAQQIYARQREARAKGSVYKPTSEEKALMLRTGGLGPAQSTLLWPISGSISHYFGEKLQGELRWKGMVITAPLGTKVKAIANGRVLMADWLQGYGLVIVLEHGKGDLSLYGYNQNTFVNVGDKVKTGQTIAQVGASGGEGKPSLYFEIRRQGKAVDPRPWLVK